MTLAEIVDRLESRRDDMAVLWAKIAWHYANRLIDLAELGERAESQRRAS